MVVIHHWPPHQLDIKNAFLHGEWVEKVYMDQPPDFTIPSHSRFICQLRRYLYRLKQSPRVWFDDLTNKLCRSFINYNKL